MKGKGLIFHLSFTLFTLSYLFMLASYGAPAGDYRTYPAWALGASSLLLVSSSPHLWRKKVFTLSYFSLLVLIFLWGSFMVINAYSDHSLVNWEFTFREQRLFPVLPGSVAYQASLSQAIEFGCLILAALAVIVVSVEKSIHWVLNLFVSGGVFVATTGFIHKLLGLKRVWGMDDRDLKTIFAPFVYNANAAAYLNLILPLTLSLFCHYNYKGTHKPLQAVYLLSSALLFFAILAAASKLGILICLTTLALFALLERRYILSLFQVKKAHKKIEIYLARLIAIIAFLLLTIVSSQFAFNRVLEVIERVQEGGLAELIPGRVAMMQKMLQLISPTEGGWHGFGPGTFPHIFPYYNENNAITGRWTRGHCDPLQIIVEWGWIGASLWLGLAITTVITSFKLRTRLGRAQRSLRFCTSAMLAALIGLAMHSCLDYPFSILSIHATAILFTSLLSHPITPRII